jgi:hypothetical protein
VGVVPAHEKMWPFTRVREMAEVMLDRRRRGLGLGKTVRCTAACRPQVGRMVVQPAVVAGAEQREAALAGDGKDEIG